MSFRPAQGLIWISLVALLLSSGSLVIHALIWGLIPVTLLAVVLAVLDWRALSRSARSLRCVRHAPSAVGRGLVFSVTVEVQCTDAPARLAIRVRDVRPPVLVPRQHGTGVWNCSGPELIQWSYSATIPVRGNYDFGPLVWQLTGPYRILAVRGQTPALRPTVAVIPEAMISPDLVMKREFGDALLLDKVSLTRHIGEGTEFESLSEYRPGDDPRRLDWRATARTTKLTVRRYQLEQHRDVILALDLGRLMAADGGRGTKLDCAVESALMLARAVLRSGDRCGLLLFDHGLKGMIPPRPGSPALGSLCTALASVAPTGMESNLMTVHETMQTRHPKRSLVVVFSDLVDKDTTNRSRAALSAMAQRHLVILVAMRTPDLLEEMHSLPRTTQDVARVGLALQMGQDRHMAVHSMARTGIQILDVEPTAVLVPLINTYQSVRTRNLL